MHYDDVDQGTQGKTTQHNTTIRRDKKHLMNKQSKQPKESFSSRQEKVKVQVNILVGVVHLCLNGKIAKPVSN